MDVWHFTEMPYPHLPPIDTLSSMRVTLPSRHYDPKIGAELYNRYLDEYMIADDLGFHHMVNEHHQTATCLDVAAPLSAVTMTIVFGASARIASMIRPMSSSSSMSESE